jgi:hypothetical protein
VLPGAGEGLSLAEARIDGVTADLHRTRRHGEAVALVRLPSATTADLEVRYGEERDA